METDDDGGSKEQHQLQHHQQQQQLTEEDLRELLSEHLASRWCCWCYPTGAAMKSLSLTSIGYAEAFVYTLVSWFECHTVQDRFMPYLGGRLDSRLEGDPPDTWDLKRPLPEPFSEAECLLTLPHSEEAFACPRCYGVGYTACRRCRRKGSVACYGCRGGGGGGGGGGGCGFGRTACSLSSSSSSASSGARSSTEDPSRCLVCSGRGSLRCPACRGRAVGVECLECAGSGRLKRYQLVHVAWTLAIDYVVLNGTELPSHKLTEAEGHIVHRQVGPAVRLPPGCPPNLAVASEFLLGRHRQLASGRRAPNTRLLLQRHSVRRIPVCRCDFGWPDTSEASTRDEEELPLPPMRRHRLHVYGLSRRVHLEKGGKALLCGLRAAAVDGTRAAVGSSRRFELATAACCLL